MLFRWRHDPPGTGATVDVTGWLEGVSASPASRILGGVLLPLLLGSAGIYCLVTQRGLLVGHGWHVLTGRPAIALGVACIAAGLFFVAHFLLRSVQRLARVGEVARTLAAGAFVLAFAYVIWSLLWPG